MSFRESGSLTLNSTISGGFGITKVGAGTLVLGGSTANTFSGTTMVNAGSLELDKPGGLPAISGNLIIGTGTGLPGSAVVSEQTLSSCLALMSRYSLTAS